MSDGYKDLRHDLPPADQLLPLAEAAALAFPCGTVTAGTLKRRARAGQLTVYRPGKHYMTTLADVRRMIEACRVVPRQPPPTTPTVPNGLGLSESDIANLALDKVLSDQRMKNRDQAASLELAASRQALRKTGARRL